MEEILSSIYCLIHGFMINITVCQHIGIMLVVFYDYKFVLKPSYERNADKTILSLGKLNNKNSNPANSALQERHDNVTSTSWFSSALLTYRKVILINYGYQKFLDILGPAMILSGFLLNVVSTFVCIRLPDTLPLLLVITMGTIAVIIDINTVITYRFTLSLTIESENFIKLWKCRLLQRIHKKQFRACSVIRLWVGPFFTFHDSLLLEHMQQVVDTTISLLLAN